MGKTQKAIRYCIGISALLILLSLIFSVFYAISYLITAFGSIFLFFLFLYSSIKYLLRVITFPGSIWYWKRSLEKGYSKIILYQLSLRTKELYSYLEDEISSNRNPGFCNVGIIVHTTRKTIENLEILEAHSLINKKQRELLQTLNKLIEFLSTVQVKNAEKVMSLIDWCRDMPCGIEHLEFVKESIRLPTDIYKKLELLLDNGVALFASLDYMRCDLFNKFQCEQFYLEMDDRVQLDCIWVPAKDSTSGVLLCSPNGGFYEFAYYQTEWLEFYNDLGFNVFLWNYRGYGRSGGKPSMDRLRRDGEVVVNYIRTQKLMRCLGVHGESLGGCIAVYLAKECVLDFLVADRTFTSLPAVALFNFGRLAYWFFRLTRGDDLDYAALFQSCGCFKLLLSDPHDNMISDLGSLKSGVALRLISENTSLIDLAYLSPHLKQSIHHILSYPAVLTAVESLSRLSQFFTLLQTQESSYDNSAYFRNLYKNTYQNLSLESESFQDDAVASCLERFFAVLSNIEAGGKTVLDVIENPHPELGLMLWLMALDIWGSCTKPEDKQSSHMKTVNAIRGCLQELQSIQEGYEKSENYIIQQVFKDINSVFNTLIEVLGFMEDKCGLSSDLDMSIEKSAIEYQAAGALVPLSCGHSGTLNPGEKYAFSRHLLQFLSAECKT